MATKQWRVVTLELLNNYKAISLNPKNYSDEVLELYSVPSFPDDKPELLVGSEIGSTKQIVGPNDVLLCKINPRINRVWSVRKIKGRRQIASSEWIVVRQHRMETRFLVRYFQTEAFRQKICADVSGVGGSLTRAQPKKVARLPVVVPPLSEQKVIADTLDTLLDQVETTEARLKRISQILKRFRQSVLAAAVSGRLSVGHRTTLEVNVHSYCDEWKWPPVPSKWKVKLYPDLVDSRLGKMLDKAKNSGIPSKYIGNINVRWFDFDLSNLQEILVSEKEQADLLVAPGDVLICEGGEPGRCAVWREGTREPLVFQKALHRARVLKEITPEWLSLNLKHDADALTLQQLFTGTTIKHLTGKALRQYPLRVPPIKEQTVIVRRVDHLFARADAIEKQVNAALSRINNLTQSILAKAFRGELTEQWRNDNPNLITGEHSAEALLERIKAERAAMPPVKRARKKTDA